MDEEEPAWSSSISRNKERSIAAQFTRSRLYARSRSIRAIPYNPVHITRLLSSVFIPISRATLCTPKRYTYFYVIRRTMKVASQKCTRVRQSHKFFLKIVQAWTTALRMPLLLSFIDSQLFQIFWICVRDERRRLVKKSNRHGTPETDQRQKEMKWRT